MKKINWGKWAKVGAVVTVSALAVPELQQVMPKESLPYVQAALAAWALVHRYDAPEKQDDAKPGS